MRQCALVTGGSGFLGSFVVRDLLAAGFEDVVVLMRGRDADEATNRLRALWWERPELANELGGRVRVVCGDVCVERLGLTVAEYEALASDVTHVVHVAAKPVSESPTICAGRIPHGDIMSIMIKMADASVGSYDGKHLDKPLVDSDWETIARAVDLSYDVLEAVGVPREKTFFGTLNAGHPGGCYPLTEAEADTLHHDTLPANLYLADVSLLPRSMGNPPILTIMAVAKRAARLAAQHAEG